MKEEEIRKREVFNKYLELVNRDIEEFIDYELFEEIDCPACGSNDYFNEFEKQKFKHVSCNKCETLFVNPRPTFKMLQKFYKKSKSTDYWVNNFFKPVADIRREKIFKPRAEYLAEKIQNKKSAIGDIGAGFGIFLEELKKIKPESQYIAIEPSLEMARICEDKGMKVKCTYFEDIDSMDGTFDVLTSFELMEHLFNPSGFLEKVYGLLQPGGYFYATTLNGKGFDILLLWEKSKSISPPHHINFFNVDIF